MAKRNIDKAKAAKKDEFYTQLEDINNELRHYREHFRGKTVLCNCDDPRVSNFFTYFAYNFEFLGLKKLITTCYKNLNMDLFSQNNCETAVYLEYYGDRNGNHIPDAGEIGIKPLKGDGDFRSKECIELLKEADPHYINYDAIEVSKTEFIPMDYEGVMGVPITFLDKYNPEQFKIIGIGNGGELGVECGVSANLTPEQCTALFHEDKSFRKGKLCYRDKKGKLKGCFARILIQKKK